MALTREEALQRDVIDDSPAVMAVLRDALKRFFVAAREHGFEHPFDVTVRDEDGDTLREFTVEKGGKVVLGRTDDAEKLFLLPLTLYATDASGRAARLRVGASLPAESIEFVN